MPQNKKKLNPIQVALVDDHQIMREGLRRVLTQEPDLAVCGEAGSLRAAAEFLEHTQPDVLVMDIGLPDGDGVAFARQIRSRWPQVKIIILSALLERQHLDDAVAAGVSGYVLKDNAALELIRAIHAAQKNETYLCPEACALLLGGYKEFLAALDQLKLSDLSEREAGVLKLIAEGRNTKEIAEELQLSVKTVESHRLRIMTKLNLHSVAELTKYAIRKGLTTL